MSSRKTKKIKAMINLKYFSWGIVIFFFNLFVMYQSYIRDYVFDASFFINLNQITFFILGLLYSHQYRKIELKSIASNSIVFVILLSILFGMFGNNINFVFVTGAFCFTFVSMAIGHLMQYFLFYHKFKRKKVNMG